MKANRRLLVPHPRYRGQQRSARIQGRQGPYRYRAQACDRKPLAAQPQYFDRQRWKHKTDPFGKTSIPNIWAAGDVTAGRQLAHKAFAQGIAIAESIACEQGISALPRPVDEKTVPQVVHSTTEAASVGYTSEQAQGAARQFTDVEETVLPLLSGFHGCLWNSQAGASLLLLHGIPGRRGYPLCDRGTYSRSACRRADC